MGSCTSQTHVIHPVEEVPRDGQAAHSTAAVVTRSAWNKQAKAAVWAASSASDHSTAMQMSSQSPTPCITPRSALVCRVSSNTQSSIWTFYRKIRTIASGGYGSVLEVESILSHQRYAVKVMDKSNSNVKSKSFDFENEVGCLQSLAGSPFVVRIHGAYESERHLYLVMELCPGGDLLQFLSDHGPQPADVAREMARQLALGVIHMHDHGVIHRDLKPENVLVSQSAEDVQVKICDFGLSKLISSVAPSKIGTKLYAAPEVLLGIQEAGPEADMWAVGLILFMMMGGYHPFDEFAEYDEMRVMTRMVKGDFTFNVDAWLSVSTAAKDAIRHCLDTDPSTRWTAKDLLKSSWLQQSPEVVDPPSSPALPTRSPSVSTFGDESECYESVLADMMCMDKLKARQSSKVMVLTLRPFEDAREPSSLETSPLSPLPAACNDVHTHTVGASLDDTGASVSALHVQQRHEATTLPGTPLSGSSGFIPSPSPRPIVSPGYSPIVRAVPVRREAAILRSKRRGACRVSPPSSPGASSVASSVASVDCDEVRVLSNLLESPLEPIAPGPSKSCAAGNHTARRVHRQRIATPKHRPSALMAMIREFDNEAR